MKVLFHNIEIGTGSGFYRGKLPAKYMPIPVETYEWQREVENKVCATVEEFRDNVTRHEINVGILEKFDVIFTGRFWLENKIADIIFDDCSKDNHRIIYDIDDLLWQVNPRVPASIIFNDATVQSRIKHMLKKAPLITTPSPSLARELKTMLTKELYRFNPAIKVIPNFVEDKGAGQSDEPIIGWSGSSSHYANLCSILPVWKQLSQEFPSLSFILIGDPKQQQLLSPHIPNLKFIDFFNMDQYREAQKLFNIGPVYLEDSRFNACKSQLKMLEYQVAGIVPVASPFYNSTNRGFKAKDLGAIYEKTRLLIKDKALRQDMSYRCRQYILDNHLMKNNMHYYLEAIDKVQAN